MNKVVNDTIMNIVHHKTLMPTQYTLLTQF